jgi:hypothetical protein
MVSINVLMLDKFDSIMSEINSTRVSNGSARTADCAAHDTSLQEHTHHNDRKHFIIISETLEYSLFKHLLIFYI